MWNLLKHNSKMEQDEPMCAFDSNVLSFLIRLLKKESTLLMYENTLIQQHREVSFEVCSSGNFLLIRNLCCLPIYLFCLFPRNTFSWVEKCDSWVIIKWNFSKTSTFTLTRQVKCLHLTYYKKYRVVKNYGWSLNEV